MRMTVKISLTVIAGAFIVYCVMPLPHHTAFAEDSADLPAGTRPATQADLEWMKAAGIPNPSVGMPVNIADANIGQAAGEAKIWLSQHATKNSNIGCLDAQFAQRLKNFMMSVPGGPPKITDAYRPPEAQSGLVASGASKAGPCQSYHNYGLAADFNNNSSQQTQWMRANAQKFGIGMIGTWDPNHFQNATGRYGQCGACSGGYSGVLPDSGISRPTIPQQPFSSNLFQPQQQCQPGLIALNGSCLPPQAAQATQVSDPFAYVTPSSGSSTVATSSTQTYQVSPAAPTPTPPTANNSSNIEDMINAIAYPSSTAKQNPQTTASTSPIALNSSITQVSSLQPTQHVTNASGTIATTHVNGGFTQTFTSDDLSKTPVKNIGTYPTLYFVLENIKIILQKIVVELKPFGGIKTPQDNSQYLE